MSIDDRFHQLGLTLPQPMKTANLPFNLTRIDGQTLYLAGHVPTDTDGRVAKPLGKVGSEVTPEEAYESARKVALGLFASIHQAIGSLDRVQAWLKVFGMVNVAPGFTARLPLTARPRNSTSLSATAEPPSIAAHQWAFGGPSSCV